MKDEKEDIEMSNLKDQIIRDMFSRSINVIKVDPYLMMKKRACFGCKEELHLSHYLSTNYSKDLEDLIKVWQDEKVQLYCCDCFREMKDNEKFETLLKELPEKKCAGCEKILDIKAYLE